MIKTKPYEHQLDNIKFHLARDKSADLSEMGTGKCLISLSKIDILRRQNLIKYTLIICPKSVMPVWEAEIKKHSDLTYILLEGSLKNKIQLLATDFNIYIITYDAIPGRKRTLGILLHFLLYKRFGMVVLDEFTYVKNYSALRTKVITSLCDTIKYSISLSGTPITNSLESVITLYRIMDSGASFGKNYFAARNHLFINHGYTFPDWHLREDKKEEFKRRLFFNAVRLLKKDCLDLPPKIFTERYAELVGITKNVYKKIAEELLKELILPEGKVKIQNSLVKLTKLSQLSGGFLYTDNNPQLFPDNPKLDLLKEVIEEIPPEDKIIIFAKWTQDIANIAKLLEAHNIPFVTIQGKTRDRATPINDFMNTDKRILLSQVTVGAYGLNLIKANYVIYYSLGFSVIEFLQSQDRIHRVGQTKPCVYISLLCKDSIDTYIYQSLKGNIDIAKSLLDERSRERLKENLLCLLK